MNILLYFIFLLILLITIIIIEFNYLILKRKSIKLINELKKKIYILEYFQKTDTTINFIDIVEYFNSIDEKEKKHVSIIKNLSFVLITSLIFIFLIFKFTPNNDRYEILYEKNYTPLKDTSFNFRGINTKKQHHLAIDYYLSDNYDKADAIFNEAHDLTPELLLFSGLNNMAKKNFSLAIDIFNKLLYNNSNSNSYTVEAQWYLALCYIKTKQIDKAKNLMIILSQTDGIYKKKAEIILKNL